MKIYRVSGDSQSTTFSDVVVAENEEQAKKITEVRYKRLKKFYCEEVSEEEVRVEELTLGDLKRFI